jgi:hypothetical protein
MRCQFCGGDLGDWRTCTACHGSSAQVAGGSAGAYQQPAQQAQQGAYAGLAQQGSFGGYAGLGVSFIVQTTSPLAGYIPAAQCVGYVPAPPQPPPLPRGEVVVGELVGWRIWWAHEAHLLHSFAMRCVWEPGVPMRGTPGDNSPEGVWAFRESSRAIAKADDAVAVSCLPDSIAVWGSVFMWGEVVEHEDGWRAEFASVRSLDGVRRVRRPTLGGRLWTVLTAEDDEAVLGALRERYGLAA